MQLTQGWVLLIDGKTLAYQTIPALTRGVAKEIRRTPRVVPTVTISFPATQTGVGGSEIETPNGTTTQDANLQVQLFNFGRVQAEAAAGEMDLATYERAGAQYFPDVYTIPWVAALI